MTIPDGKTRQLRKLVYALTRRWGQRITVRRYSDLTINRQTGKSARAETDYTIKRAIVSPARQKPDFVYDLSFIAANKNFTYGGYFDVTDRYIVVDVRDLDRALDSDMDTEFNLNRETDRVIINNRLYEIKAITEAEIRRIFIVHIRMLESTPGVS